MALDDFQNDDDMWSGLRASVDGRSTYGGSTPPYGPSRSGYASSSIGSTSPTGASTPGYNSYNPGSYPPSGGSMRASTRSTNGSPASTGLSSVDDPHGVQGRNADLYYYSHYGPGSSMEAAGGNGYSTVSPAPLTIQQGYNNIANNRTFQYGDAHVKLASNNPGRRSTGGRNGASTQSSQSPSVALNAAGQDSLNRINQAVKSYKDNGQPSSMLQMIRQQIKPYYDSLNAQGYWQSRQGLEHGHLLRELGLVLDPSQGGRFLRASSPPLIPDYYATASPSENRAQRLGLNSNSSRNNRQKQTTSSQTPQVQLTWAPARVGTEYWTPSMSSSTVGDGIVSEIDAGQDALRSGAKWLGNQAQGLVEAHPLGLLFPDVIGDRIVKPHSKAAKIEGQFISNAIGGGGNMVASSPDAAAGFFAMASQETATAILKVQASLDRLSGDRNSAVRKDALRAQLNDLIARETAGLGRSTVDSFGGTGRGTPLNDAWQAVRALNHRDPQAAYQFLKDATSATGRNVLKDPAAAVANLFLLRDGIRAFNFAEASTRMAMINRMAGDLDRAATAAQLSDPAAAAAARREIAHLRDVESKLEHLQKIYSARRRLATTREAAAHPERGRYVSSADASANKPRVAGLNRGDAAPATRPADVRQTGEYNYKPGAQPAERRSTSSPPSTPIPTKPTSTSPKAPAKAGASDIWLQHEMADAKVQGGFDPFHIYDKFNELEQPTIGDPEESDNSLGSADDVFDTTSFNSYDYANDDSVRAPLPVKLGRMANEVPVPGARGTGINRAWKLELGLLRKFGRGSRGYTTDDIEQALAGANYTDLGLTGHHSNAVKAAPQWAGDPRNIFFLRQGSGDEHMVLGHPKGTAAPQPERPLIDRKWMLDNLNPQDFDGESWSGQNEEPTK